MKKTNAARILDKRKIFYELKEYAVDLDDLGAENVAAKIAMPIGQVFKTLVARGDKTGVIMACIPGNGTVDLKSLAACSGNKKVEMVHLKEILDLTGYMRGGVSPLGAKKFYPVYMHTSIRNWPVIAISAGIRGCQIIISPDDLIGAVDAKIGDISRPAENI